MLRLRAPGFPGAVGCCGCIEGCLLSQTLRSRALSQAACIPASEGFRKGQKTQPPFHDALKQVADTSRRPRSCQSSPGPARLEPGEPDPYTEKKIRPVHYDRDAGVLASGIYPAIVGHPSEARHDKERRGAVSHEHHDAGENGRSRWIGALLDTGGLGRRGRAAPMKVVWFVCGVIHCRFVRPCLCGGPTFAACSRRCAAGRREPHLERRKLASAMAADAGVVGIGRLALWANHLTPPQIVLSRPAKLSVSHPPGRARAPS
jgi:hypothetical protein